MRKRLLTLVLVLVMVVSCAYVALACGFGSSKSSSSSVNNGTYYLYEDGDYDRQSYITVRSGKVTAFSKDGADVTQMSGVKVTTKISGSDFTVTLKMSENKKTYTRIYSGTISKGVIHVTSINDGEEDDAVDMYFCKEGYTPDGKDNNSGDNNENGGSSEGTKYDGKYYLYNDGYYDRALYITVSKGNVAEFCIYEADLAQEPGVEIITKINGSDFEVTLNESDGKTTTYAATYLGTISNGVIYLASVAYPDTDGDICEMSLNWYYCKDGYTPDDADNGDEDNSNHNPESAKYDGQYYMYENGYYDKQSYITVTGGKVTAFCRFGNDVAQDPNAKVDTKISDSTFIVVLTLSGDVANYEGTISNGVIHITHLVGIYGDTEYDMYYCKKGYTPDGAYNGSDDNFGNMPENAEYDGQYYMYENDDYDKQSYITVTGGKVTAFCTEGNDAVQSIFAIISTKISGSNFTFTLTITGNVLHYEGTISNGVIHLTSYGISDGSRQINLYYCKEGYTPDVEANTVYTVTFNGAGTRKTSTGYLSGSMPTTGEKTLIGWAFKSGATKPQITTDNFNRFDFGSYADESNRVTLYPVYDSRDDEVTEYTVIFNGAGTRKTSTGYLSGSMPTINDASFLGWAFEDGATEPQITTDNFNRIDFSSYADDYDRVTLYPVYDSQGNDDSGIDGSYKIYQSSQMDFINEFIVEDGDIVDVKVMGQKTATEMGGTLNCVTEGANFVIDVSISQGGETVAMHYVGMIDNGVICVTSILVTYNGQDYDNRPSCEVYFCKKGKTPDDFTLELEDPRGDISDVEIPEDATPEGLVSANHAKDDSFKGAVSEQSYNSTEAACVAFINNEICGEATDASLQSFRVVGTLNEDQTEEMVSNSGMTEYDAARVTSVTEIEISYKDGAPDKARSGSVNPVQLKLFTMYVFEIDYSEYKYFAPELESGDVITKSYYDEVFDYSKYVNCTLTEIASSSNTVNFGMGVVGVATITTTTVVKFTENSAYAQTTISESKVVMQNGSVMQSQSASTTVEIYVEYNSNGEVSYAYGRQDNQYWYEVNAEAANLRKYVVPQMDNSFFIKTDYGFTVNSEKYSLFVQNQVNKIAAENDMRLYYKGLKINSGYLVTDGKFEKIMTTITGTCVSNGQVGDIEQSVTTTYTAYGTTTAPTREDLGISF